MENSEYSESDVTVSTNNSKNSQSSEASLHLIKSESGVELSVKFDFIEQIGKGGFGTIHKVRSESDNQVYAVKEFHISSDKLKKEVTKEISYLALLHHTHVVRYYCGLYKNVDEGFDDTMFYILMELCTRSLKDYLEEKMKEEQSIVDEIFNNDLKIQLLSALDYVHGKNIIHRDIKPANIFLKENGSKTLFVLGDFGLACDHTSSKTSGESGKNSTHSSGVGTQLYSAPEQINSSSYTFLADIYSSGLVFFEAYCLFKSYMELIKCFEELRNQRSISTSRMKPWENEEKMILKMTASESFRPTASELLQELQATSGNSINLPLDLGHLQINGGVPVLTLETLCEQLPNVVHTEEDVETVQECLDEISETIANATQ